MFPERENLRSIIYNRFMLELWYQHCTNIVEITHKIQTSFKTLASKKASTWRLKNPQRNGKRL